MPELRCAHCGKPYPDNGVPFRCPECGGLFDEQQPVQFEPSKIDPTLPGMWRFRSFFNLPQHTPMITLGEGNTPLVLDHYDEVEICYKLESLNPTGSYKDRGSAVLVSQLVSRGVREAVEDSSGNAGASFAAYAARSDIHARIFVPESASGPKLQQIKAFGAELVTVPGPRSKSAEAVLKEAEAGVPYASHAFLPFGLPGIASISYEIWEQMRGIPGTVIAPAGHGALLLGIVRGFAALQQAGLAARQPYYVGVQAQACAPLVAAMKDGLDAIVKVTEGPTLAEGVRVSRPARAEALRKEIPPEAGQMIGIAEDRIAPAFHAMARRGIYAEPTSALVWAALEQLVGQVPEPICLIVSGSGLKLGYSIE